MSWLPHVLGLDNPSGRWYAWWSGFFADATVFGAAVAFWRHKNCHTARCWRLSHHPGETCRKHASTGKAGSLERRDARLESMYRLIEEDGKMKARKLLSVVLLTAAVGYTAFLIVLLFIHCFSTRTIIPHDANGGRLTNFVEFSIFAELVLWGCGAVLYSEPDQPEGKR